MSDDPVSIFNTYLSYIENTAPQETLPNYKDLLELSYGNIVFPVPTGAQHPGYLEGDMEFRASWILGISKRGFNIQPFKGDQVDIELITETILHALDFKFLIANIKNQPNTVYGRTDPQKREVHISENLYDGENDWLLREVLAHELSHAIDHADYMLWAGESIPPESPLEQNAIDFSRMILLPQTDFIVAFLEGCDLFKINITNEARFHCSGEKQLADLRTHLAQKFGARVELVLQRIMELKLNTFSGIKRHTEIGYIPQKRILEWII